MILQDTMDAVIAFLRERLPDIPTIEKYPDIGERLEVPAVVLEIGDFESFGNSGDDQIELGTRFEARVIVDPCLTDGDELVRILAARAAQAIMIMPRPSEQISNFRIVDISRDFFKPQLDGLLVWLVEFAADINFGEEYWQPGDVPVPTVVLTGVSPQIGTDNEDQYTEVTL